ncbi:MAG: selenocysteine-specific translation elongation factor [Planctomycetes bacterium]|nr:selenocysteine-specific translation elongation factor [Planctomycetota bacterium]
MAAEIHRIIVGTAGHIDHGKSSLVRALTGVDPDRLKEEKDRGMTIDLGFAPYATRSGRTVGFIDVPGHERFVKNMVAGASSVDVFVLVVAADDGVMPQTREHVDILDLLGARRGLVAVTKIDLVDPELRELAVDEIREYLAGSAFEGAPLSAVSIVTGEGMDGLRHELDRIIEETPARSAGGVFRMPVQRVFSARGHGIVLTGVPLSGSVALGEQLEVLPQGFKGKVRGIQAYREDRDHAFAGHSTALNLSDVDYRLVRRGDVVASPGLFRPARMLEAELRYLAGAGKPLKHGAEVRLHVGTAEALARVVLLNRPVLEPGEQALVQFRLREAVVATRGDRFLVRQPTPAVTLGGGIIVSESERRLPRLREASVAAVQAKVAALDDIGAFLERLVLERGLRCATRREAPGLVKRHVAEAQEIVAGLLTAGRLVAVGRDRLMHREVFAGVCAALRDALRRFHDANPLRAYADGLALRTELRLQEDIFDAAARALADSSEVVAHKGARIGLAGAGPRLSPQEEAARERIRARLHEAGLSPPSAEELAAELGLDAATVQALLVLLVEQEHAFRARDIFFDAGRKQDLLEVLRRVAAENKGEILVPRVRDLLGTTRKYLIPLLEYLDSHGHTVRRGERRFFVERPAESAT